MNDEPINEALMLQYLRDVAAYYAPQFPEFKNLTGLIIRASVGSDMQQAMLWGYINDRFDACYGYGKTYAEAAADLRAKLGTSETKAKSLRKQAAELLAEADKLESAP